MPEAELADLRNTDKVHQRRGLLVLYFIDPQGGAGGGADHTRLAMDAEIVPVGIGMVFPGQTSRALRVAATKVAVDVSGFEVETPDDRQEGVEADTEADPEAKVEVQS